MKPELCQQLFNRFPWAEYKDIDSGEGSGEFVPCWVKDGWYHLIYNMLIEIENVYKVKNIPIYELRMYEIKEKYASMQTSLFSTLDEVYDIVEKYETLSEEVCEECGSEGTIRKVNGWLTILCDSCSDKRV